MRHRSAASALVVLTPLIGLLPASYQEAVERRYGLPASRSTGWSAAAILAVASAIFVLALGQNFATRTGAGDGDGWGPWLLPASYFMVESLLRLGAAMTAGEANGTLPFVLLLQIPALLRGRPRANPRLVPGHAEALRASDEDYPLRRYYAPTPRLVLGGRLRGIVSAVIDLAGRFATL